MTEFVYKTYRCEWQLNVVSVDQYGVETAVVSSIPFPSYQKAFDFRPTIAHEHEFVKGRWVPNDAKRGYLECCIQYKEVLVK